VTRDRLPAVNAFDPLHDKPTVFEQTTIRRNVRK
jgi:hypothetical protein